MGQVHPGKKAGGIPPIPPGIPGGIAWIPPFPPGVQPGIPHPPRDSRQDPAFHPESLVGSRLPPGIQGGILPVLPRVQPWIPPSTGIQGESCLPPGIQAGSCLSRPGFNPGFHIPSGIQGGILPPTRDPKVELETRVYSNHNEENRI